MTVGVAEFHQIAQPCNDALYLPCSAKRTPIITIERRRPISDCYCYVLTGGKRAPVLLDSSIA